MLQTKKDVDRHVRSSLARLREDEQRNKGYSIARLYYKIGEYTTAIQYLSSYIAANDRNPVVYKFLGECYEKLKKPDKALAAYQRSLELDKKQSDLLIQVCKLLQMDELSNVAASKARYYYELAESRNIQHEAVLYLKLKHLQSEQNGSGSPHNIQEIILRDRPFDIGLRIRLLRNFLDQNKVDDAFNYVYDIEIQQTGQFCNSTEWYMAVKEMLNKYKTTPANDAKIEQNWPFWLLSLITADRQVYLSLAESPNDSNAVATNLAESTNYLYDLDQMLQLVSTINPCPQHEKELNSQLFSHFRGQLCLHAASLLFKREIAAAPRDQWPETTRKALPLLLLAYNCGVVDNGHPSLRNSSETTKVLINLWNTQSAFRCSQAGRTLISCIDSRSDDSNATLTKLRKICNNKYASWSSADEVLTEIRRATTDSDWRKHIQRQLFTNIAQEASAATSYLVKCAVLQTPTYKWPQTSDLETYEEIAQKVEPSSLSHLVYLALCFDSTKRTKSTAISSDFKCLVFSDLNFATTNSMKYGAETPNKLDVDTFLYAATIQAKRTIEVERSFANSATSQLSRPQILPYVNMAPRLCTKEQDNWWKAAYKVHNNISDREWTALADILQQGIDAIRGVNPNDLIILLKVAQILVERAQDTHKLVEKTAMETRAVELIRSSLSLLRDQNSDRSKNDSFLRLFHYQIGNQSLSIDKEVNELIEEAIAFLADRHFRNHEFGECIADLEGIRSPFATYFQAEASRKIAELANTQKKDKRAYLEKAKYYLTRTLDLLDGSNIDKNHPLKSIVQSDFKRLQQESRRVETNQSFNDSFVSASNNSRSDQFQDLDDSESHGQRRDVIVTAPPTPVIINNNENIEKLIREMMSSLTLLKEDVADVRDRVQGIEEQLQKKNTDLGSVGVLDDYLTEEDFQQAIGSAPWNNTSMFTNVSRLNTPNQSQLNSFPNQQSFGSQDVSALAAAALNNPYLAREMNPLYGLYGYPPNMLPNAANTPNRNQQQQMPLRGNFPQNQYGSPFGNDALTNYNMIQQYGSLLPHQGAVPNIPNVASLQGLAPVPQTPPSLLQQVPQGLQPSTNFPIPPNPIELAAQPLALTTTSHSMSSQQQVLKTWSSAFNNAPVEKGPPVNVVITSSDPLPAHNTAPTVVQSPLSVTIPPQHIKNSNVAATTPSKANPTIMAALRDASVKPASSSTPTVAPSLAQQQVIFGSGNTSTPKSTINEKANVDASKPNPFASFSFGSSPATANTSAADKTKPEAKPETNSSFSNIFGGIGKAAAIASAAQAAPAVSATFAPQTAKVTEESAANTSKEDDDDYVPTAHFEPVIALPDLVEVKTGEEGESILFEHRAKLLRFVRESKEWKERGIGSMKVLVNKDDKNKVRLLMRREKVLKLCCNQLLAKDTTFKKLPNSEVALSWYGQDYSENELQIELLAIRFKTADICKQFHDAILKAQAEMSDTTAAAVKPVAEKPTPTTQKAEKAPVVKADKPAGQGFGDQFKPKTGSWTCEGCYLTNDGSHTQCPACNTPKDKDAVDTKATTVAAAPTSKFTFGSQPSTGGFQFGTLNAAATKTAAPTATPPTATVAASTTPTVGFGDKFKPKAGSWSCKACYTSNKSENLHCLACEAPKDDTVPAKEPTNVFGSSASTTKFLFGKQPDGPSGFTFGSAKPGGFSFGNLPPAAPAATPTQPIDIPKIESKEFGFVFKPKSPGKAKSPLKTQADGYEDVTDDENVEEEENNTYFAPVIPLPDKVDVKTGEENEEVLYSHRAKLFRFKDSEWKERGLGDLKILQHKETGRMRVVMRREQVLKICLNHALDRDVEYIRKDDKSWHFVVNDFSEGELELEQLCLRFKTAEIAADFKKAIDDALSGVTSKQNGGGPHVPATPRESIQSKLSADEKKKISDLKLPANFFDYKNVEKCAGCRGCASEEFSFAEVKVNNVSGQDENPLPLVFTPIEIKKETAASTNIFSAMNKSLAPSQNNSFFFGSNEADNNAFGSPDTGVVPTATQSFLFGTASRPKLPTSFGVSSPVTNAENTTQKTETTKASLFSFGNTSLFGGSATPTAPSTTSIFGGSNTTASFSFGGSPAPAANKSSESQDTNKSFFGSTTLFGQKPAATPLFGGLGMTPSPTTNQSPAVVANATPETSAESTLPVGNVSFASLAANGSDNTSSESSIFKLDPSLSFSALASTAKPVASSSSFSTSANTSGGFFGLSTRDDFSNLMTKASPSTNGVADGDDNDNTVEDVNYDPHYDPIIALPDEITVTTGEEEEQKVFGERAKLFRFDATNREWKERGVGEFKLLHHPKNNTYRLLLRREQVYKCVLNQALSADFLMNPMKQSDKAYCWVGTNFAEDTTNGAMESLSVRFKNAQIAQSFEKAVNRAIENLKARGELEPEED